MVAFDLDGSDDFFRGFGQPVVTGTLGSILSADNGLLAKPARGVGVEYFQYVAVTGLWQVILWRGVCRETVGLVENYWRRADVIRLYPAVPSGPWPAQQVQAALVAQKGSARLMCFTLWHQPVILQK